MSSPDPQVRAARNHTTPAGGRRPVVAVTGAATGVGALLTERLAASEEIKQVVAVDERRGECDAAEWHILDVRDPAIAEKLRGADVVVHLALDLDLGSDAAARTAYNVRGTQTVLTAAAAAGVHRVVLCTSAMVYGALPDNELPCRRTRSCAPRPRRPASGTCWRSSGWPAAPRARIPASTSPSCGPRSWWAAPTPP